MIPYVEVWFVVGSVGWVSWGYESRMTLGGRGPTSYYEVVQWFKDRGFDRVVFLGGEGKRINYTGDGYEDGR
ncbi:hypothetical protein [Thermococcus sp.]|uniref:hypothetical protein n=1 Tax=Thermococcus sp. TaxID=35749 RepID=UPI002632075F|nr:hypothetical protein [Thermococcus sp.]